MASDDNPFTTCETLIVLDADTSPKTATQSDWWRALLEGEPAFDAKGARLQTGERATISERTRAALDAGYHPILLFPARVGWTTVVDALGLMRYHVGMLFRGEDDGAIRYLLRHPSLEVLQARAGLRKLAYPNRAYKEALDQWLRHDRYAKDVIHKLRERDVRLEDFEPVDDAGTDAGEEDTPDEDDAPQRVEFVWSLDRAYHMRFDYPSKSTARLIQWHKRDNGLLADGVGFAGDMLWFAHDKCDLSQRPEVVQAIKKRWALPMAVSKEATAVSRQPLRSFVRTKWQIPASAAAGLAAGFVLAYIVPGLGPQRYPLSDGDPPYPPQVSNGSMVSRGEREDIPQNADKLTEQEWLEAIADAVLEGEIEKAQRWLRAFKRRYPDATNEPDQQ